MNTATLMVVLLAAAAAFGMGYVVGSSGSESVDAPLDPVDLPDTPQETPKAAGLVRGTEGPQLEGAEPQQPGIRALIRSFPIPERESGDGTITGSVKTAAGEPVEGIQVTALPNRDRPPWDKIDDPEERLVRMIRRQVEAARWREANEVKATTGADGRFTLDGLRDVEHRVSAKADDWRMSGRNTGAVKPGATVEFTARRVTGIHLDVFGPDGAEVATAAPSFRTQNSRHGGHWRPNRRFVEVKPGLYDLHVKSGEHGEFQAGPIEVQIVEGESSKLRVDLELRPILVVKLEFDEGETPDQGQLYLLSMSGADVPTGAILKARGKSQWMHRYNRGAMTQTFADVKPGRHALGFVRGHGQDFDIIEVVDVGNGLTETTLKVPSLDPDRYAVVTVLDPDGNPVTDARFTTGYYRENSSSSGGSQVIKRPRGEYYVLHQSHAEDESGGTYWIQARAGNYGSKRVEYKKRGESFTIRFEPPGTANVAIEGFKSRGEGQQIYVMFRQERAHFGAQPCDERGLARFKALQPGKYDAQVSIGEGHRHSPVHTEEVTVRSGKNAFSIRLPPLYSVTVRGADKYVWIQRVQEKGGYNHMSRHTQAADGEAVFDALPAGKYRAHSRHKQAEFDLPGTSVVVLEPRK